MFEHIASKVGVQCVSRVQHGYLDLMNEEECGFYYGSSCCGYTTLQLTQAEGSQSGDMIGGREVLDLCPVPF